MAKRKAGRETELGAFGAGCDATNAPTFRATSPVSPAFPIPLPPSAPFCPPPPSPAPQTVPPTFPSAISYAVYYTLDCVL